MKQPRPTTDHLIVFLEWLDAQRALRLDIDDDTFEDIATRYLFERTTAEETLRDLPTLPCGCEADSAHGRLNAWCGWKCKRCGARHHWDPTFCGCGYTVFSPMYMEDWS